MRGSQNYWGGLFTPFALCQVGPTCGSAAYMNVAVATHSFVYPRLQIKLVVTCSFSFSPTSQHLSTQQIQTHPLLLLHQFSRKLPSFLSTSYPRLKQRTHNSPEQSLLAMSAPNTPLADLAVNSTTPIGSSEASPNVQPMHQGSGVSSLEMQRQLLQQKLAEQ